jgi:hypothetical protein
MKRLLGVWAKTRDAVVGEAIEKLAPPDPLIDGLATGTAAAGKADLEKLEKRPPDPRAGAKLAEIIEARPYTSTTNRKFWTQLFKTFAVVSDPRVVPRLRAYLERLPRDGGSLEEYLHQKLPKALDGIEAQTWPRRRRRSGSSRRTR